MDKQKIFVILGKSNTGKSTIFKKVMELIRFNNDDIELLKSCTTRPKREEDKQDNEYDFVDKGYFTKLHKEDGLLEYSVYDTVYGYWFYFTRIADLKDKDYIKIINPSGLAQLRDSVKKMPYEVIAIEIIADDEVRMERALKRNDGTSIEEIERRFNADSRDFRYIKTEYKIENNGDKTPEELAKEIYNIIKKYK